MSQLLSVRGGRRLEGAVTIQGAKNSVLPILAATLLARGQVALLGCPRLRDVDASIRILRHLGCDAHWEADALAVDTTALRRCEISDVLNVDVGQLLRDAAGGLVLVQQKEVVAQLDTAGLDHVLFGVPLSPRDLDGVHPEEQRQGHHHGRADHQHGQQLIEEAEVSPPAPL